MKKKDINETLILILSFLTVKLERCCIGSGFTSSKYCKTELSKIEWNAKTAVESVESGEISFRSIFTAL